MPVPDLELLSEAVDIAGEIARRYWKNAPDQWTKPGDAGPVTEADLEIDRTLRDMLISARPDYGWLSEESADSTDRLGRDRVFILDPIDGTRAFIEGSENFSHSLAIAEHGRVIAAAVHLPILDRKYLAARGRGATVNGRRINPERRTDIAGSTILAARSNLAAEHWRGGKLPAKPAFRSSLAYRLCLVADGSFDAAITLRPCWEWDIAAGDLIAREAGAVVSDQTGGALRFNNPQPLQNGLLVSSAPIHRHLVAQRDHA